MRVERPCILLVEADRQRHLNQGETAPTEPEAGWEIWWYDEDHSGYYLGYAHTLEDAAAPYSKTDTRVYVKPLESGETGA